MIEPGELLNRNRRWAADRLDEDGEFFQRLVDLQKPAYLWIGCSDSRVPATEIVDMAPGEMFVHRNVANQVVPTDLNCLSAVHYAVAVLKVRHIIVCGHYGCGGIDAAYHGSRFGLVDNWLRHVGDLVAANRAAVDELADTRDRLRLLCELNVREQVRNLCRSSVLEQAWLEKQPVTVHGWIYDLHDGLLKDLEVTQSGPEPTA